MIKTCNELVSFVIVRPITESIISANITSMLRFLSHFWLVLSLLVAPLPYALADMTMLDQGEMKCESADQAAMMHSDELSSENSASSKESCECCDQCGSSCSSCIHFSVGLSQLDNFQNHPRYASYPKNMIDTAIGLDRFTEFRPPRKLHA